MVPKNPDESKISLVHSKKIRSENMSESSPVVHFSSEHMIIFDLPCFTTVIDPEILSIGNINLKDVILSGLDQSTFVNDLVRSGSRGQVFVQTQPISSRLSAITK